MLRFKQHFFYAFLSYHHLLCLWEDNLNQNTLSFFVDLTTWEETVDNMFLLFIQYEKMHLGLVFKIMHYDIARKAF